MKSLKPLSDRIAVTLHQLSAVSTGGIIVGAAQADNTRQGTVLEVGPGAFDYKNGVLIPLQIKVGDVVVFSSKVGESFDVDGQTVVVMGEPEVLAIITE